MRVQYCRSTPEASIIYYNRPLPDTTFQVDKVFLPKPNGYDLNFEIKYPFLNLTTLNDYLQKHGQPAISYSPMFIVSMNQYFKSGLWYGCGLGGWSQGVTGNIGMGYLQKLSRRYYLNFSVHFTGFDYIIPLFWY